MVVDRSVECDEARERQRRRGKKRALVGTVSAGEVKRKEKPEIDKRHAGHRPYILHRRTVSCSPSCSLPAWAAQLEIAIMFTVECRCRVNILCRCVERTKKLDLALRNLCSTGKRAPLKEIVCRNKNNVLCLAKSVPRPLSAVVHSLTALPCSQVQLPAALLLTSWNHCCSSCDRMLVQKAEQGLGIIPSRSVLAARLHIRTLVWWVRTGILFVGCWVLQPLPPLSAVSPVRIRLLGASSAQRELRKA